MRSLHLVKTGIGASWALRQIKVLIECGVEVHVALGESGPMEQHYIDVGAIVHRVPIDLKKVGMLNYYEAAKLFRETVASIDPDIIHSHFVGTTLFMRLALRGHCRIPRLFQVPGPLHLEHWITRKMDLLSANDSDYWCASCKLTRSIYEDSGIDQDRIFLSYYGTDVHLNSTLTEITDVSDIRSKYGIPLECEVVGMVGYMYPPKRWLGQQVGLKGHEDLIEAISLLTSEERNIVVVFAGGQWGVGTAYENKVRRLAKKRLGDRAIFLGNVSDVPSLYSALDLVVHPSHSENLGGAAESLLLGVPTISTNVGGFPDIVIHEKTGFLVPKKSPVSIARAVSRMLDSPREADMMALNGRHLTSHLLDVQNTGAQMEKIYEEIVRHHHPVKIS